MGKICLGKNRLLDSIISEIVNDANDFEVSVVRRVRNLIEDVELDLLADRIFGSKVVLNEHAIDYRDTPSRGDISGREQTSANQLQPEG